MDFGIRGKGKADYSPSGLFEHEFCLFFFIFCKCYENNSHVYFVIWKKLVIKGVMLWKGHIRHCMCRNLSQANYESKWTFFYLCGLLQDVWPWKLDSFLTYIIFLWFERNTLSDYMSIWKNVPPPMHFLICCVLVFSSNVRYEERVWLAGSKKLL